MDEQKPAGRKHNHPPQDEELPEDEALPQERPSKRIKKDESEAELWAGCARDEKSGMEGKIRIGERLIKLKAMLGHGKFLATARAKGYSPSTAENYMTVAEFHEIAKSYAPGISKYEDLLRVCLQLKREDRAKKAAARAEQAAENKRVREEKAAEKKRKSDEKKRKRDEDKKDEDKKEEAPKPASLKSLHTDTEPEAETQVSPLVTDTVTDTATAPEPEPEMVSTTLKVDAEPEPDVDDGPPSLYIENLIRLPFPVSRPLATALRPALARIREAYPRVTSWDRRMILKDEIEEMVVRAQEARGG